MLVRFLFPLALALAGSAQAASVTVVVKSADGRPIADAVVVIDSPRAPSTPIRFPWPYEMAQQDIMFAPHVLIVPVGAQVTFPNRDRVRHHVYSASKAKKFDLKLYGREETRSLVFDRPGAVALGCNIHDAMSAVVFVTTSPYTVKTDGNGRASFAGVPGGNATVRIWHPAIRAPGNVMAQSLAIAETGTTTTLTLAGR